MRSDNNGGSFLSSGVRTVRAAVCFSALAAGIVACSTPQLVPVTPSGSETALVQSEGVAVEVDGRGEGTPAFLPANIEPVRVVIHNGSERGIHVSLDSIELAKDNVALSPVAPRDIEPLPYVTGTGLDPASPFAQSGVGPVGVDIRLATEFPAVYHQLTMGDTGVDMRRAEIIDKGFADGFIEAGQTREGFVYFENVPTHVQQLNLIIPVHTGQGSGAMTTLTVPLEVKG
jgi:hypothetical protein